MENKIVLELISKNIEEIKFLLETMLKEEKPDQLLIEIATLKAKSLYQELRLLLPKESEVRSEGLIVGLDEPLIVEQIDVTVQNEENTSEEIATDESISNGEEIAENNEMNPDGYAEETLGDEEKEVITIQPSAIEVILSEVPEQELISSPVPENDHEEAVYEESGSEFDATAATDEAGEISASEEEVLRDELTEENIPEEEHADLIENTQETIIEEIIVTEIVHDEPENESTEKKIFGEQFVKEPSLNDKLASINVHESKIKAQPILSLKGAIGLNDRFLFTRELFGNDPSKYELSIDQLDESSSILEAVEFLEKNFQWTKNDASLKFMELVKRRFDS